MFRFAFSRVKIKVRLRRKIGFAACFTDNPFTDSMDTSRVELKDCFAFVHGAAQRANELANKEHIL